LFTDPGAALNAGFPGYHNPPNLKAEETDSSQVGASSIYVLRYLQSPSPHPMPIRYVLCFELSSNNLGHL
jgi:hypothetical protein